PRMPWLIGRFGVTRLIVTGMISVVAAYVLFLPIGLHSSYALGMLPTFLLAGTGFALAFGPLNVAATSGGAAHEPGLAGRLDNAGLAREGARRSRGAPSHSAAGARERRRRHRRRTTK